MTGSLLFCPSAWSHIPKSGHGANSFVGRPSTFQVGIVPRPEL
jgi:hypothetical protein